MKHWEIIADNLSKAGWSWGCVSAVDSEGRTNWIVDAYGYGKRKVEPQIPDLSANDDGRAALGKVISEKFRNLESPIP